MDAVLASMLLPRRLRQQDVRTWHGKIPWLSSYWHWPALRYYSFWSDLLQLLFTANLFTYFSALCNLCYYIYIIFLYCIFLLFTIFGVEFDSQIELKSQKLVAHSSNAICLVARRRFGTVTTVLVVVVVLVAGAAAATVVVAAATANTYTFLPLFCCCRAHIFSLANFSCFF